MNILFIGDIVGKLGRIVLKDNLSLLINKYDIDFVICNAENISNGKGITKKDYLFLKELGVNCITLGNHYARKSEIYNFIDDAELMVRPINVKNEKKGVGSRLFEVNNLKIRVTNILGIAFMGIDVEDPYLSIEELVMNDESDIHIIDYHAEATGEKKAFAYALKNSVTAVLGTHTHVQTNDAQILKTGVAYISDVGMCGGYNSVLGSNIDSVVSRIIFNDDNVHFKLDEKDDMQLNGVVIKINDINLMASSIIPISIIERFNYEKN